LITIGQAYKVSVDRILNLNGILQDTPLQIGQKLVISTSGDSGDDSKQSLSPIEKLTPAADGRYYHTVKVGDIIFIAIYKINLAELMAGIPER
jgi:hypothetical protein